MKYLVSSETNAEVGDRIGILHGLFDEIFEKLIQESSLSNIDVTILYVPIIMSDYMHERFQERSRFIKKTNTIECCPHLHFAIFEGNVSRSMITEYARGIALAGSYLQSMGATLNQIEEFRGFVELATRLAWQKLNH